MKRSTLTLSVAAVALWSAGTLAQGRNFGGNWTIDTERMQEIAAAGGGGAVAGMRSGGGGGRGGGGAVGGVVATGEVRRIGGDAGAAAGGGAPAGAVARSGGGGGRGGRGGPAGPMAIALDANAFTVGNLSYKLDGSVTSTETLAGTQTAKAAWKADRLVIEITTPSANGPIVSTQTWYLEGDSLVRETSTPGPDGSAPRVSKLYYKRS
jgi:hypothetical protein